MPIARIVSFEESAPAGGRDEAPDRRGRTARRPSRLRDHHASRRRGRVRRSSSSSSTARRTTGRATQRSTRCPPDPSPRAAAYQSRDTRSPSAEPPGRAAPARRGGGAGARQFALSSWPAAAPAPGQAVARCRFRGYTFELDSPVHELDRKSCSASSRGTTRPSPTTAKSTSRSRASETNGARATATSLSSPTSFHGTWRRSSSPPVSPSTHWFSWQRSSITFGSSSASRSSWRYQGPDVPPPSAPVRINFWLDHGFPPTNGKPVEIVVRRFTFTPAP